MNSWIISR